MWLEKVLLECAKEKKVILDVGCSDGYLSKLYSKEKCRIFGLDFSFEYLKIAADKSKDSGFIQGDILELPLRDKSIDILVCSEVLEHMADVPAALNKIKRVTKRVFVSTVPILPQSLDFIRLKTQKEKIFMPGKGHFRNFQVRSYLELLRNKGFKIKKVHCMGFLWWFFSGFFIRCANWPLIFKIDSFFSNAGIFKKLVLDVGVIAEL
jgi:ubiquinone/menaquinone biosynthesis C-methylase UbiE